MKEDLFKRRYDSLNKGQKEAVDSIDGPVMVIAGPGTGKTTVLTLRIANILRETDTPPSGILAITYTDAGVRRMREKLREIMGNRAHEVEIHTFHSFASEMISSYPDHFIHLQGLKQMTDVDQELIVRSIISRPKFKELKPLGRPDAYLYAITSSIDGAKREALTPKNVREYAKAEIKRIEQDENSISTRGVTKGKLKADALDEIEKCKKTLLFADVYELYEERKREESLMDFNDLITELLVAMREDELLLRLIQERFLYILVDEHQDTNDAQNLILSLVAEFFDTPNLFIVGDEKQAIYRFQGASVENFLKLRQKWPKMKLISLDMNYRSHQAILDAGFSMIENNYTEDEHSDLRIELKSGVKAKSTPIEIITGENTFAMEEYLVKEVKRLVEKEPEASIAIIVRRNRDLERVLRLLESNHIPVSSERSVDIFHHPVGLLFFDLLEYLKDRSRDDCLARTLTSGMWGLSFDESVEIFRNIRAGKPAEIGSKIPALEELHKRMLTDGAVGFIIDAAQASGFADIVSRNPAYVHVWRGIVTLAESLVREGRISDPSKLVEAMLAYRQSAETRAVKVSVGAPDLKVKAMTAHGSKGQEFDYVLIPYANDESWIGRNRGSSFVLPKKSATDSDMRDVRRLFYVALTRARKHVEVLSSLEESDGKELSPLRFISELEAKSVTTRLLPRVNESLQKKTTFEKGETVSLLNLARKTLLDTGISVTALNHFLNCPNEYLYESVLKMPQMPSATATKGTAMHEAIAAIWKNEDRSESNIEKIIIKEAISSVDNSFLSANDKEALKDVLKLDAPIIANSLSPHFSVEGMINAEKWMRALFGHVQDGTHHIIPTHGKLDAVIDDGQSISVFDYKTKQAMSVAEIRGETKNSDGDYLRQLAFYKLLVTADKHYRGRNSSYSLVFVSPDKKGRCSIVTVNVTDPDIKNLETNIHTLANSVLSGEVVNGSCDRKDCEYCAWRSTLK